MDGMDEAGQVWYGAGRWRVRVPWALGFEVAWASCSWLIRDGVAGLQAEGPENGLKGRNDQTDGTANHEPLDSRVDHENRIDDMSPRGLTPEGPRIFEVEKLKRDLSMHHKGENPRDSEPW